MNLFLDMDKSGVALELSEKTDSGAVLKSFFAEVKLSLKLNLFHLFWDHGNLTDNFCAVMIAYRQLTLKRDSFVNFGMILAIVRSLERMDGYFLP